MHGINWYGESLFWIDGHGEWPSSARVVPAIAFHCRWRQTLWDRVEALVDPAEEHLDDVSIVRLGVNKVPARKKELVRVHLEISKDLLFAPIFVVI